MKLVSLKDYAEQNGITYEAVRQQVARYRDALGDHIVKDGRQQFLDEYAVEYLNEHRSKNPVVIIQNSKDEEIQELRAKQEAMLAKIAALSLELKDAAQRETEYVRQIAAGNQTQLRLEGIQAELDQTKQAAASRAEEDSRRIDELTAQLSASQEANRALLNRGLFARIFNKEAKHGVSD